MKIIIYGFMACGKTTTAKILSKKLKIPFYDTDDIIERIHRKSVSKIINEKGLTYFRQIEKMVFSKLVRRKQDIIISVGGGIFPRGYKRDIEVFLNVNYSLLEKRFLKVMNTRPLLKDFCKNPQRIRELYNKRLCKYKKARFVIKVENSKQAAEKIAMIYEKVKNNPENRDSH